MHRIGSYRYSFMPDSAGSLALRENRGDLHSLHRGGGHMGGKMAFVLGGGGGRGALQVGALRALLEENLQPDMLVGTSAGAVNATYIAVHGFTPDALKGLEESWQNAAKTDLLPMNPLWLTAHMMFHRVGIRSTDHMRRFFVSQGLSPEMRFKDLSIPLIQVSADLNKAEVVLYGTDPDQSVLEGLLASTTLPSWFHPLTKDGRALMDGGVVSNVPIEPALRVGASKIIALDITESNQRTEEGSGAGSFLRGLMHTIEHRQIELELELAAEQGVKVWHWELSAQTSVPTWDFSRADELFQRGYQIARGALNQCPELRSSHWERWPEGNSEGERLRRS